MTMMIDGHGPGYHAVQTRPSLEDCQRTLKKFVDETASPTVSVQDLVVASRATKDRNIQWSNQLPFTLPGDLSDADIDAARTRVGHAMLDEQEATVALRNLYSYFEEGALGDVPESGLDYPIGKGGKSGVSDDVGKRCKNDSGDRVSEDCKKDLGNLVATAAMKITLTSSEALEALIAVVKTRENGQTDWAKYLGYHCSEAIAAEKISSPIEQMFSRGANPGPEADGAAQTVRAVTGQLTDAAATARALREAGVPVDAPQRLASVQQLQTALVSGSSRVNDARQVLSNVSDASADLRNADRDFAYLYKTSLLDAADQRTQAFAQQHVPPGYLNTIDYGSPYSHALEAVQAELKLDGVHPSAFGPR